MHNNKSLKGRTVLFKTLFGSKLYGTNTPLSDEDWKEVFLPVKVNLLKGRKPTNIVISTGGDKTRNTKDDVDYEYIPIQVFANDFIGGQTYAVEMAFSILSNSTHAEQELFDPKFEEFTKELVDTFLTSNIRAMIGYAMNQAQIYGIKGTRLASVRKFTDRLADVIKTGEYAPQCTLRMLEKWVIDNSDKYMFMSTYENMGQKHGAISILEKLYPLTVTIQEAYERTLALKDKYGSRAADAENAKGIDWKATAHAIRITKQAITLLRDHELVFPFPQEEIDLLLSIKNGERPFNEVAQLLADLFEELDQIKETTTLRERSDALDEQFEEFMSRWMLAFYE